MTVLTEMKPSGQPELYALLVEQMRPRLLRALEEAGTGQRLRVTSLPEQVMSGLCEGLQGDSRWIARVLSGATGGPAWQATATKLIELRNVLEEPLLVFIPPGLRTAAEDSLDIATFNELSLSALAEDLVAVLLSRVDAPLRGPVTEALAYLRQEGHVRNYDQEVEYLLTTELNGGGAVAAGGALYVFGLLPDFQLFTRGRAIFWLSRNIKASEQLAGGQPLQTAVLRLPIKPNTLQARLFAFLRTRRRGDVRSWALDIAQDHSSRELALDRWEFVDSGESDELRLVADRLSLPRQTEDQVAGAAQLPVLNLEGKDPLKVAFRSIPLPGQATAWKTWRVQILSIRDGVPTAAWESNSFPKPQRQAKVARSVKVQELQALEEGTYYLKVDAYDGDGALLTHAPRRVDDKDASSRAENESERFLVVRGADADVEPDDVRATFAASLLDAWVRVAQRSLNAKPREVVADRNVVRGEWDEPMGAPLKGDVHFELKADGFTGFSIIVPSLLRRIEREVFEHPDQFGTYALSFADARSLSDVEITRKEVAEGPVGAVADAFIAARRAVFQAIYGHHLTREGDPTEDAARRGGLVETADLAPLAGLIERYAEAYVTLTEDSVAANRSDAAASLVRTLAHLDVIELRWRHGPGDPGRALLIAPTHPVRLLWHLRHTLLCAEAIQAWEDGTRRAPDWRILTDQLRSQLLPMNLPMVLFDRRGRGYVEHTPITQFWPLYLPDRGDGDVPIDAVATRDRVLAHMAVHDENVALTTVDTQDVASRLYEYLAQHPYVDQLRMNVFNPGDARLVADVLRYLEEIRLYDDGRLRPNPPPLRYAVQLFAAAEFVDVTGDGLEGLLDPERQVGSDDEFTLATSNHLLPKLVFARNPVSDFLQAPEKFSAHVSILLEQFVVQTRVGRIEGLRRGSYVGGLVQEPETQVEQKVGAHFGWVKGLRPQSRRGATPAEALLRSSLSAAQRVQASLATGAPADENLAPVVALQLDPSGQALLKQVHEVSDWVLTLDRNLGLDYFDSPSSAREAGYLLDFAPEYLQEDRQRILLTTRSHVELENLVRPIMTRYGLPMEPGDEVLVLETLRSLSGRLALRLEGGRNQAAEVVGLLLARWLLERVGLLEHRIVIPLDAHHSWFGAGEPGDSQRRADLLLVGFREPNVLRFDIVEVKLREELNASSRSDLYATMRKQTENTQERLRRLFALDYYPEPRADEMLRSKELASALAFYVRRARRYELFSDEEMNRALAMLENLDEGYQLDIRSLGVVFEHKGIGLHLDEEEPGFPVHRFGGDKARQLLADAAGRLLDRNARISERDGGTERPSSSSHRAAEAAKLRDEELDSFRSALDERPPARPAYPTGSSAVKPVHDTRQPPPPYQRGTPEVKPFVPAASAPDAQPARERPVSPAVAGAPNAPAAVSPPSPSSGTLPSADGSAPAVSPEAVAAPPSPAAAQITDVLIGATELTPQYGIIGKCGSQKVAVDLNGCNTISLFGVQGFGKSYTLGVIAEMASVQVAGISVLPSPLATVIFHYHKSDAYEPEYASAVAPNRKQSEVERLLRDYGARPQGLTDVVLLAPEAKVEQRRKEYPGITVEPIKFASSELGSESWKFLLGAYGNDSLYIRQLVAIMRRHRGDLTLDTFRQEIATAQLPPAAQRLADDRVNLAAPYIDDERRLGNLLRPGRTVIVDLRDEWIEKDEALGLFVVMLRIFAATKFEGSEFNKLVVFDEAHKYITESDLIGQVVETIREMRHQATSVVIASQDPLSVPRAVIELTSILILHRMTSPQWMKHLKTALVALDGIEDAHMSSLAPGEALIWAQRSTEKRFTQRPQKITIRPRFTQHGGGTKTAVAGVTVR